MTNRLNKGIVNLISSSKVDTEYRVSFSVNVKLEDGQCLAVAGDLPQLGMWTDFTKLRMEKASGDTWVSVAPLVTEKWVFQYKYVICTSDAQLIRWEQGVNHIADL